MIKNIVLITLLVSNTNLCMSQKQIDHQFNSILAIKISYQNQYLIKGNGVDIGDYHIFSVSFNHNFDFIK